MIHFALFTLAAVAPAPTPAFIAPAETESALIQQMTEAAQALDRLMPASEAANARFAFGGPEHRYWHWIPAPLLEDHALGKNYAPYGRVGWPVEKMTPEAIRQLHQLLRVSLSAEGYRKVEQVFRREGGDDVKVGFEGLGRTPAGKQPGGPGWYFFSTFGPIGGKAWGWRIEGHHLSLNFEIEDGHVRFSPLMVGHNPSPVPPEPSTLAVQLLKSLSPAQQKQAMVIAPDDTAKIPLEMDRGPARPAPAGVVLGHLSADGLWAYQHLIEDFVDNYPEVIARDARKRFLAEAPRARLAWWGPTDDAHPHVYRLEAPDFIIQVRHQGLDKGHPHVHSSFRNLTDGSAANKVK